MFARERSTRGQMKSPSIAQRGEGGVRGGSGESVLLFRTNRERSVTPEAPKNHHLPERLNTKIPAITSKLDAMPITSKLSVNIQGKISFKTINPTVKIDIIININKKLDNAMRRNSK